MWKGDDKVEGRDVAEDGGVVDAVMLGQRLSSSLRALRPDEFRDGEEVFLLSLKGRILEIPLLLSIRICEWDLIVCPIWIEDPLDAASATWTEPIMPTEIEHLLNLQCISHSVDWIGMEIEELLRLTVKSRDTSGQSPTFEMGLEKS